MTVREILYHFVGNQKVTIIEYKNDLLSIIYLGHVRCCLQEIPIVYADMIYHDWKVINGMLNIWI